MGLGFINHSRILPDKSPYLKVSQQKSPSKKTKEYHIESLVLPMGISGHDEKEILHFIELLLAGKFQEKVQTPSLANYRIALDLVSSIQEQAR